VTFHNFLTSTSAVTKRPLEAPCRWKFSCHSKSVKITGIYTTELGLSKFLLVFHCIFIACQRTDVRYLYSKSVCLSVCPWRFGIRWKRLNIRSQFFTIR